MINTRAAGDSRFATTEIYVANEVSVLRENLTGKGAV